MSRSSPRFATKLVAPVIAASLLALTLTTAQASSESAYKEAMALFLRAVGGESAAIDDAASQWRALSAAEPNDPVLRAYAGAAAALKARNALLPWRKMGLAEDGLAQVDKALAQLGPQHDSLLHQGVPASLETRFVAAKMFLDMPSFFNRAARGTKLLDEVAASPVLDATPLGFRGEVWLILGQEAAKGKRNDEAKKWLSKAIENATPQAPAAQAKLKEL